jgi:ubiquinone/menaquinone biosynthesis C-methylase UbiE
MRKFTMSKTVGQETAHTISVVRPHLTNESSLLDVGCGSGWVAATLAHQVSCPISTVDIGDFRQVETADFHVFDGLSLPFPDKQFDVVLFSFVLHHVPDELKPLLLAEARRVCRGRVLVLEDTPVTWFDRWVSRQHGERFRRKIGSCERFGFLVKEQWLRLFSLLGLHAVQSQTLSRWCRSMWQPFARTAFVLEVV